MKITRMILGLLLTLSTALAVPQLFKYQGSLSHPDGSPYDSTITLTLRLYDEQVGGAPVWSETYSNLSIERGLFSVTMGQTASLDLAHFSDGETYLGIVMGNDPEMTPRSRFVAVPYSYQVLSVDGATAGTLTGRLVATGSIQGDTLISQHGVKFPDGTLQATAMDTVSLSNRINAKADSGVVVTWPDTATTQPIATKSWVSEQITAGSGQQAGDTNTYDATRY
ncbi:hypothetical protein IT157_00850, partial [bacterium]|nr:hypothetical protein [bacterium]